MKNKAHLVIYILFILTTSCRNKTTNHTSDIDLTGNDTISYTLFNLDTTDANCLKHYKFCPNIKISYPIFNSTDTALNTFLNNEINNSMLSNELQDSANYTSVLALVKEYFAGNAEMKKEGNYDDEISGWTREKNISVYDKTGPYITLSFYNQMFEGGAHPNSSVIYAVYDIATKKQVQITDILRIESDSLLKIATQYFRHDNDVSDTTTLANAGYFVFGDGENFEDSPNYGKFRFNNNFALTKAGIEFQYNTYEIAPYVVGAPSVILPKKDIFPFLKIKPW